MKHLINLIISYHRIAILLAIMALNFSIGVTSCSRIQKTHDINCNSTYVSDDGYYKINIIDSSDKYATIVRHRLVFANDSVVKSGTRIFYVPQIISITETTKLPIDKVADIIRDYGLTESR